MKIKKISPRIFRLTLGLWATGSVGTAGRAAEAVPAQAQTHTLFMGADIDLQQGKEFHRVHDVSGGSFVIKVDGKEKSVPMKYSTVNMKVDYQLKLTETSAKVGNLVVDRAYTPGNDPNLKFAAAQSASAGQADVSTTVTWAATNNQQATWDSNQKTMGPNLPTFPNDPDYQKQSLEAQRSYDTSAKEMRGDLTSSAYKAGKLSEELAEGMFDALEITFDVSAEIPLNSPYAVVVAQFRENNAKPNEMQNWIFATELDPITSQVHRVRIKEGGFPRGFELKNYQLHLYNRGQEVASTVASKRVPLTRDEAFDYVLVDYLTTHKGQTQPATLVMGKLSAAVRNNLPVAKLFVKVSKDGLPIAAFADEDCTKQIDDLALAAALHDLRFKPALDKGKPVDGVARLGST